MTISDAIHDGHVVNRNFFCPELAAETLSDDVKMQLAQYAHIFASPGTYYGVHHTEFQNCFVIEQIEKGRLKELEKALQVSGQQLSESHQANLVKAQIEFFIDNPIVAAEVGTLVRGFSRTN